MTQRNKKTGKFETENKKDIMMRVTSEEKEIVHSIRKSNQICENCGKESSGLTYRENGTKKGLVVCPKCVYNIIGSGY